MKKYLESIADRISIISDNSDINNIIYDSAVNIVKEFIIKNKCIVYGGTAIDYALKLKGSYIYPESKRPDYDFYSYDNVNLAYELASILIDNKFNNVKAVCGLHMTTMKVFIDDTLSVADISFIPKDIYEKLPFLIYDNIRFINPIFQRLDMHLSLTLPFNGKPLENITFRWEKDLKRFNLLDSFYPVDSYIKKVDYKLVKKTALVPEECIFAGFMAYAVMCKLIKKKDVIEVKYEIKDGEISCYIPEKSKLYVCALEFEKSKIHNNPFLGLRNTTYNYNNLQIEDVHNRGLTYLTVGGIKIASHQHTLMYFLLEYFITDDVVYLLFYKSLLSMINASIDIPEFSLSINLYGEYISETYLKLKKIYMDKLEKKVDNLNTPKPYYSNKKRPDDYDYNYSEFNNDYKLIYN
jgi:hypothetical protein